MSEVRTVTKNVTDEKSIVRSSIPLHVLCNLHRPVAFLWFMAEILIFIWKGMIGWPTDWTIYGFEIFALCLTLTLEYIRLEILLHANLSEQIFLSFVALILTLISIVTYLYWAIFQWFVLVLDFVISCSQLLLCLFELILIFTALISFCKKPTKEKTN